MIDKNLLIKNNFILEVNESLNALDKFSVYRDISDFLKGLRLYYRIL